MFANRRTWADHEMQVHRRAWECRFCLRQHFDSLGNLRSHVMLNHKNIAKSGQLEPFLEICSRPLETLAASTCDFCNWSEKLMRLKENREINPQEEIHVTAHQFMKHVAGHLEQIALFALPRSHFLDAESAAAGIGVNDSDQSSRALVRWLELYLECWIQY